MDIKKEKKKEKKEEKKEKSKGLFSQIIFGEGDAKFKKEKILELFQVIEKISDFYFSGQLLSIKGIKAPRMTGKTHNIAVCILISLFVEKQNVVIFQSTLKTTKMGIFAKVLSLLESAGENIEKNDLFSVSLGSVSLRAQGGGALQGLSADKIGGAERAKVSAEKFDICVVDEAGDILIDILLSLKEEDS